MPLLGAGRFQRLAEGGRGLLACAAPPCSGAPTTEERKLTVLFTGIVGSTAKAEQMDAGCNDAIAAGADPVLPK